MVRTSSGGYAFGLSTYISGLTAETDHVRVEWKQGGKLLATAPCTFEPRKATYTVAMCDYSDKPLSAKGAIDAELIYSDHADGNDYLLRTYKLTVARYPSFGDAVWQLVPDDLLGAAWVWHDYPQKLRDARAGHPHLLFWVARDEYEGDATLHCTIDGAKQPDIRIQFEPAGSYQVKAETHTKAGATSVYSWLHLDGTIDVYFGKRADYPEDDPPKDGLFLADHPGAWQCAVEGKAGVLREVAFTVGASGFITSALQTAKGAVPTLDHVAAVELRFPKGVKYDTRVRPDAMRKSRGYGLSWPDDPAVKADQASFPPASGLRDP